MSEQNIGDVTSNERGTGARFSAGKAPLHFIPSWIIGAFIAEQDNPDFVEAAVNAEWATDFLEAVWRATTGEDCVTYLFRFFDFDDLREAAWVFEYGSKKYAAWNWAKGMAWSIPVGCIERHALEIAQGTLVDDESGRKHVGHILCNVIMLVFYARYFVEGNDLIPLAYVENDDVIA